MTTTDKFGFVPNMLFFVLGFKDILRMMQVADPKTPLQQEINIHCDEDMDHWRWYLHDLEMLGFKHVAYPDQPFAFYSQVWGEACNVPRDVIYQIIHEIKSQKSEITSLVLIELLEAAFGAFIQAFYGTLERSGLYNDLLYFGKNHVDKELAHSRGAWTEDGRSHQEALTEHHQLTNDEWCEMEALIEHSTPLLFQMFDFWYQTRNAYARHPLLTDESDPGRSRLHS